MNESSIFGISVRGYIVFMLVTSFVVLTFLGKDIDETFTTLVVAVVMFYFGNKPTSTANTSTTELTTATSTNQLTETPKTGV